MVTGDSRDIGKALIFVWLCCILDTFNQFHYISCMLVCFNNFKRLAKRHYKNRAETRALIKGGGGGGDIHIFVFCPKKIILK